MSVLYVLHILQDVSLICDEWQVAVLKSNRMAGIVYIIIAGFCFSLMTLFVRIAGDLPTMQKAFFRNAVAAVVAVVILARSEEGFRIKKTSWPGLMMRSICGTTGLILNFYAIDHMNIADANMLNKLSPFFAIIMSVFVLKETANKWEWGAVIMAFIGALFVIKPSFQMSFIYGLIGAGGGLGAGIAYAYVRKLGKMGERSIAIVMFFSLFSTLVTLPFFIFDYHPMTLYQLVCLLAAGVCATGGQLGITKAYTKAPAKEISVFDYTQILFAAMWGFLFLDQAPDIYSLIGYVIIIGTAIWKWQYAMRLEKKED